MRHLRHRRDAVDQHHLVAPVELVGLARRETQRHERRRCRRVLPPRPGGRIAPHRVVAAPVAEAPQLREHPHQREPLSPRAPCDLREDPVELLPPRADLRLRLHAPVVLEGRLVAPDDLTHRVARHVRVPADLLDRPAAYKVLAAHPRDRVHTLQPPPARPCLRTGTLHQAGGRGSIFGRRSPRSVGQHSMPIHTLANFANRHVVLWRCRTGTGRPPR
jgi:hypothetical protein